VEIAASLAEKRLSTVWGLNAGSGSSGVPVDAEFAGIDEAASTASRYAQILIYIRKGIRSLTYSHADERYGAVYQNACLGNLVGWQTIIDANVLQTGSAVVCTLSAGVDSPYVTQVPPRLGYEDFAHIWSTQINAASSLPYFPVVMGKQHTRAFLTKFPADKPNELHATSAVSRRPLTKISPITNTLNDIEASLHLTRSQLSQALQVERATLYQWFRGALPRAKTIARIEQLASVAKAWSDAGLGSARGLWGAKVQGTRNTLGELLREDELDIDRLHDLIDTAKKSMAALELVEPEGIMGFPADSAREERRRNRDIFPATFGDEE
jgi:transcriptional regulator with XRE-family HTH domain